ncbi:AGE family epimerase/isomerase [Xanthobacter dioxanivorans]|uniref:AGE family epimerase/isomerase n=1 Tax=Xanthobacter dioxanivorans TaxID=2528964 RepID=A0A974PQW3_9HYPH|nr:AGE family epimerase/isomerase [Xanthobacter dioxanivorans]QRG07714.1 AGE family epimerase/isomerase [Xanthobacter dioxanivorans]
MTRPAAQAHPLADLAEDARAWMFGAAAPLWASRGRHPKGLFAERLDSAGAPDDAPRRLFVQARHVYAFCEMGRLGWDGPWQALAGETMDYLLAHGRRPDDLFIHRFTADGQVLDKRADLYDQAFMLFCLGHAGRALSRPDLLEVAEGQADALEHGWRHPAGGFVEHDIPRPFRHQNPHMHFFEAFSALFAVTGRPRWKALAEEMATLCRDRFIDPATGALIEYFTQDLVPAPGIDGTIVEPGHCFEWAWLFEGLSAWGWPGAEISDRLVAFGRRTGIDPVQDVAINEVLTDGSVHKATARLWPQTERLKVALARLRRTGRPDEEREARRAYQGLKLYLDMPVPGTWQDVLNPDGTFVPMPAPGSSLYHITCAMAELVDTVEGRR